MKKKKRPFAIGTKVRGNDPSFSSAAGGPGLVRVGIVLGYNDHGFALVGFSGGFLGHSGGGFGLPPVPKKYAGHCWWAFPGFLKRAK